MYIPYLLHATPGTPTSLPQTNPLIPRDESPPTATHNSGFWEVQFNFWGTILAFLVALGIITGILTWCLVCRGKRMEKKLAKAKEKELAEEERRKREIVERAIGVDGPREGGTLGEKELEVESGVGMDMGMDIPIYNPRDVLANKRGSTHTTITSVSEGHGWHRVEVNGKMNLDRERTDSTFLDREIKFV